MRRRGVDAVAVVVAVAVAVAVLVPVLVVVLVVAVVLVLVLVVVLVLALPMVEAVDIELVQRQDIVTQSQELADMRWLSDDENHFRCCWELYIYIWHSEMDLGIFEKNLDPDPDDGGGHFSLNSGVR
jgi:hypothetical protein